MVRAIVFIDCVRMKIYRKRSMETKALYVVPAVSEDKSRKMLEIFNKPTKSVWGWGARRAARAGWTKDKLCMY